MDPQVTKMCHSFVRNRKKVDKTQEPFQPPAIEDGHEFLLQLTADNCHFPSPSLANFLKMKCGHELDQKDLEAAATSLLHSQALAFRLLAYFNASKKVRKQDATAKTVSKPSSDSSGDMFADEDERTAEQIQKQILSFQSMSGKDGHVQRLIETLPAEWRVVQITADPHRRAKFKNARAEEAITDANFDLVVTSFQCGSFTHSLNMEKVQAVERGDRPTIMKEFFDMLLTHRKIYQKTKDFDRAAYNLTKDELEDRMKSLLDTIENKWLGYAKVFLLGRPKDQERVKRVEEAIEKLRKQQKLGQLDRGSLRTGFLFSIFDGASSLNKEQLLMAFQRITDKKSKLNEMVRAASEFGDNNPSLDNTDRHPVSLILDRDIQSLPWETLPIMRDQACARVPSIFFLCALYETHEKSKSSVTKMGVRNDKIFYVLNPNNDLKKTQERLEPKFKDLSLGEGVVGTWPSNPQFQV